MVPHRTPFFLPHLFPPHLVWRVPSAKPELYLTFDDGPVNGPTDFVLEQLKRTNTNATFFCIGDNIRKHEGVFRKIVADGHAVGNHTYHHLNGWKTSTEAYLMNIQQCQEKIESLTRPGNTTRLFRPPYGRITRKQIKQLPKFKIVMWDVLSIDYDQRLSAEKCLRNTIKATRNGSIIVFHDSFKAEKNLEFVLPRYLDHFKELGFVFNALK